MPRHLLLALVFLCLVFRALAAAHEPSYTITLFNVPGTTSTTAFAINARGQIIGDYRDASFQGHGYLFYHRIFMTIDPPGGPVFDVTGMTQIVGFLATPTKP